MANGSGGRDDEAAGDDSDPRGVTPTQPTGADDEAAAALNDSTDN